MGFRDKLKSIKCLEGVIYLRRFYLDDGFKDICRSYYDEHARIMYYKKTDAHDSDRLILKIPVNDDIAGFFCNYLCMLNTILKFEAYRIPIVVDWTESPYQELGKYKETNNPFEYYFEPVSGVTLAELQSGFLPVVYNKRTASFSYLRYQDKRLLEQLADVDRRYIRLREDVKEQMTSEICTLLQGKRTIGVHVRGVEWGKVKSHPVPVSLERYISYIDEAINRSQFEQIFLATDSEDTVAYLRERYGEKMVYFTDALRSSCGSETLVIFDKTIQKTHHQYRMGYEVLRDVEALACCDGFIGGLSNVAWAAEVFKMSRREKFDYKTVIQQEILKDGIKPRKAKELMEKGEYHVK